MFKNYLKITVRNIKRHKGYTFINIVGLAIGTACCILILLWVHNELSYDRFHDKARQIYRVAMKFNIGTNQFNAAMGPVPLADALVQDFPEVLTATRLFHKNYRGVYTYVRFEDKQFREEKFLWTDSTVFDIFTIPLIEGVPKTALKQPNSVILTPATAEKYFGNSDPMGKMLTLEDGTLYKVTGIAKPLPRNSHFHFDFLASFSSLEKSRDPEWYDIAVYTYVLLPENFQPDQIDAKFPDFSRKYYESIVQMAMGITYNKFLESGNYLGFFLQALLDIHLYSDIMVQEFEPTGNINTVIIFSAIAIVILLVACINFINLATARSTERANEVGVRKVVGSSRRQLVWQFLAESILLCAIAIFFALNIVIIFLPTFNNLVGKSLTIIFFKNWLFLPGIICIILIIGIIAGSYPAFLLASFRPVTVLKGKIQSTVKGRRFRNALVVVQFVTSIILFIGTIVIYNQLHYIRNKKLGINKEHIVVIKDANKLGSNQQPFKNDLKRSTNIINATYTDGLPQMILEAKVFQKEGAASNENNTLITIMADHDFMDTYQPQLSKGRFFDRNRSTDSSSIILNEGAINALGIENPLEKRLLLTGRKIKPLNIIGVFKDFHLESLHFKIRPMAAMLIGEKPGVLLSVRIRPGKIQETLHYIERQWNQFVPNQPLEYVFFDDQFNIGYKTEIQTGRVMTAFASLAILLACLGLFGLASFIIERRTKEIGIRKVLGASVLGIVSLLSKEFTKWVLLANIIAWPIAYYAMNNWLQNFTYHASLEWWIFISAAGLALVIALFSVIFQSIKAAITNPLESLRYE